MVRILKFFIGISILISGAERAVAFSLLGPYLDWQIPLITYQVQGDIGGPQNLGEEYRRNTPVLYYTFDQTFIDFYGSNGIAAVEQAFQVLNGLTNVSEYSTNLNEFPLEAQRFNFRAQALSLTDIKSYTLWLLMEQMGLAEPDRYTWTLRNRSVGPGGCPGDVGYAVIKRNFEVSPTSLDQLQSSSYVNGTLYSYRIQEFCTSPPANLADAVEFPVDPLANTLTAVAAFGLFNGSFYTGLTRDDVAGLRYLLRANNINLEASGPGTETFVTNTSVQLLYTSNLTQLAEAAYVNDAAALTTLFPGLQIASTTQYFTNLVSTNTVTYFTNYPWSPAGAPATLATATAVSTNIVLRYKHEFANVVTNHFYGSGTFTVTTTNSSRAACVQYPWLPGTFICTFVGQNNYQSNGIFGDYYLLPTNACGVSIVATQLVQTANSESSTTIATNLLNVNEFFSQTVSTVFTQYVYQVKLLDCPENTTALRQGVERVRFVRRDYDSLVGTFFEPITNEYNLVILTNNSLQVQRARRVVTSPDFVIDAQDLGVVVTPPVISPWFAFRTVPFASSNNLAGLNGPGIMRNNINFTYNKVGAFYYNFSPGSLDEANQQPFLIWGSFDGSTNAPVVYPNGTSIQNLENQLLLQVTPAGPALPNAVLGLNYTNQFTGFTATGGAAPYNWTLPTAGLPPGLSLNAASGKISGVPTTQGIFDFTIRMTESGGSRFVDRPYSITVTP